MPVQQDTVHSYRPTLPITYQYHLKPGESFYKDRNGKVTIVALEMNKLAKILEIIGKRNRTVRMLQI